MSPRTRASTEAAPVTSDGGPGRLARLSSSDSFVSLGAQDERRPRLPTRLIPTVLEAMAPAASGGARAAMLGAGLPLRHVHLAALLDPVGRAQMKKTVATLEPPEQAATFEGRRAGARLRNLPMLRSAHLKRGYLSEMRKELLERSTALREAIDGNPDRARYNVAIVGAGPHGTSAASVVVESGLSCLVLEAGNVVSANFGKIQDAIRINSAVRAADGAFPQTGKNDINPIEGPVKVPDMTGARWPGAAIISQVAQTNLAESGADVLFDARVVEVAKVGELGYTLTTGDRLRIQAQAVIWATGLGQPINPFKEGNGAEIVRSEIEGFGEVLAGRRELGVATSAQALELVGASTDPLAPYRDRPGRRIKTLVIGEGDSAYTFFEALYGLNSEAAYMNERQVGPAQLGNVGPSSWIVGDGGYENCREFVAGKEDGSKPGSRGRYAALAAPIGRNIAQVQGRADKIERLLNGRFQVTVRGPRGQRKTEVADRVVLATGYAATPFEIPAALPVGTDAQARLVPGRLANGENANLGLQIGSERIYVVGPAAGPSTVPDSSTEGIPANKVSLFNNTPRVVALALQIAASLGVRVEPIALSARAPLLLEGDASGVNHVVELEPSGGEVELTMGSAREILAHVLKNLYGARVAGSTGEKPRLKLIFEQTTEGVLDLRSRTISADSLAALGERLAESPTMVDLIDAYVAETPRKKLKFTFPLEAGGQVNIELPKQTT